jgi:hypothetical protein
MKAESSASLSGFGPYEDVAPRLLEHGDHVTNRGFHHCFAKAEIEAELKAGGFRMCHYSQADYPHTKCCCLLSNTWVG